MKIYCIRDRLLDYYMTPFVGPNDKAVLASIAQHINNPETTDAIAQAPHHFEIWELGEVHEDGHIEPSQKLVADCSSLIRPGIRDGGTGKSGDRTHETPDREKPGQASHPAG